MAKSAKKPADSQAKALTLTDLKPAPGSNRRKLRVGRGRASGAGKTCNRGHNGEGQRAGRSQKRGFEGGQMPLYRRTPKKKGFRLVNQRKWLELNLSDMDNVLLPNEDTLTYELLRERGFMGLRTDGVRILGNGELSRKITIQAHHVTKGAREKIEAAGGTIQLIKDSSGALVE